MFGQFHQKLTFQPDISVEVPPTETNAATKNENKYSCDHGVQPHGSDEDVETWTRLPPHFLEDGKKLREEKPPLLRKFRIWWKQLREHLVGYEQICFQLARISLCPHQQTVVLKRRCSFSRSRHTHLSLPGLNSTSKTANTGLWSECLMLSAEP